MIHTFCQIDTTVLINKLAKKIGIIPGQTITLSP